MGALDEKIQHLPAVPGVYLFKDPHGEVLYVGKAKSLAARVRNYLAPDPQRPSMTDMMARAVDVDTIVTATEVEALMLESTLIRQHKPHFNVMLKDDKSFPFVKISLQDEFPRLSVTRRVRDDGARYLGPYTDVKVLRRTLRDLRRIFPLRTCRNFEDYQRADRPCLYFHIKRCAGPCYSRARVNRADYRRMVDGLLLLLAGRNDELVQRLRDEMAAAAEARHYEVAAQRRDQIALLEKARVPQNMVTGDVRDTDVVGLAREGRRAAIATLLVRGGRVIGKESRLVDRADESSDGVLVGSWVAQALLARRDLPRRILLGALPNGLRVRESRGQYGGRRPGVKTRTGADRGRSRHGRCGLRAAACRLPRFDLARGPYPWCSMRKSRSSRFRGTAFKDALGEVLYVGKAKSLAARVRNYLAPDPQRPSMTDMMARAVDVDTIVTATEVEALMLESTLIRQHKPHFNVMLKDDKSFPFVKVSVQEEFPRLSVTRRVRDDGARYLGPYTDVRVLRRTLRDLRRVFPVRTCRNFEDYRRDDRPCLYFHIKRCAGPCYSRARVDVRTTTAATWTGC